MNDTQFIVEKIIKIKTYDIDAFGHVSNITYIRWFEDLRILFLDKYYPLSKMLAQNITFPIIKTEIEYKRQLKLLDSPTGKCWINKLGPIRWSLQFEIIQNDIIYCTGFQHGFFLNLLTNKPARTPDELFNIINEKSTTN